MQAEEERARNAAEEAKRREAISRAEGEAVARKYVYPLILP